LIRDRLPSPLGEEHLAQAVSALAGTVIAGPADLGLLLLRCGHPEPQILHPDAMNAFVALS
jgi:hypothetical protein